LAQRLRPKTRGRLHEPTAQSDRDCAQHRRRFRGRPSADRSSDSGRRARHVIVTEAGVAIVSRTLSKP
jgi:hypothetical protein